MIGSETEERSDWMNSEQPALMILKCLRNRYSAGKRRQIPRSIKELEGNRDLFGNLYYLSSKAHLDLQKVFEYPLTLVPLSLGSVDGIMNSTNKSILQHQIINPHLAYGEIAKDLLIRLCQMSNIVHFITSSVWQPNNQILYQDSRENPTFLYK